MTKNVYIGTGQAAQLLDVSSTTIRRWVQAGHLQPQQTTMGGHFRFSLTYIQSVVRNGGPQGVQTEESVEAGRPGERGQGLVEFAIVVPLLLLFILGFLALGNTFRQVNAMNNAADSGAFYASLGHPAADVTGHIEQRLDEQLVDPAEVEISIAPAGYSYGDPVTISITKTMRLNALLWQAEFDLPVHSTQIVQKEVITGTGGSP